MEFLSRITEVSTNQEIEAYVLQALKRRMDKNGLILELCNVKKWKWPESEVFVNRIEKANAFDLSILWTRIFLVAGLVFLAAGLFGLLYFFDAYVGLNTFFQCIEYEVRNYANPDVGDPKSLNCMAQTLFGLTYIFSNQTGILLIMLMAGGIGGMITAQVQHKRLLQSNVTETINENKSDT